MKKKWSRKAALLLAAVTILTSLPTEYLYAAQTQEIQDTVTPEEQSNEETVVQPEEGTEQQSTEVSGKTEVSSETDIETQTIDSQTADTQNSDTTEVVAAEDLLNYLVLDSSYIAIGGTQNVVASIGNDDLVLAGGRLLYHRVSDGTAYEMPAAQIDGNGLRFSEIFADESRNGEYVLDAIIYEKDGQEYKLSLSDAGMDVKFGVNTEVETNPDAEVVDEAVADVDMDVVSFDENGNQTSEDSITEAIENQQQEQSADGITKETFRRNGNAVVVLDPGHDGTHGGSSANGFVEAQLNLKIAQYCKEELEQYHGVTVYMTRDSSSCPNGGGNNKFCLQRRADIARDMGANLFVSIHNNYSSSSSASGAEVWYPNQNYNPWTSQVGGSAASKILEQLTSLGLKNRGTQIRSAKEDKYPDGSAADYYAVIRHTKEYGIPGIIVEHAFMSNSSDAANFLSNDAGLQRLGVADATGIANYFGLKKGIDYSAVFDATYYADHNPDIKASIGTDENKLLDHFVNYGMNEGRQAKADFDVWSYRNRYQDLRIAYGNNLPSYYLHYINGGKAEGRVATGCSSLQNPLTVYNGIDYSAVYNYSYYLNKYSDLKSYTNDDVGLLAQFVNYGINEGRQASANFDVVSYRNANSDLRAAYGNDLRSYYLHYIQCGQKEGRKATGVSKLQPLTSLNGVDYSAVYDYNYYISKYADVKNACGNDDIAALKQFVNYGMKEGRQASSNFNVYSYRNEYPDLRVAFGKNLAKYYLHYIQSGKSEGRKAIGCNSLKNPITTWNGVDYAAVYNYSYYLSKYSDVKNTYGYDDVEAMKHFVNYGMTEGRQGNEEFDVYIYKANYSDLEKSFGNNLNSYYIHYIQYGKAEGRMGKTKINHSIMNTSTTSINQMVNYFNAKASYSNYYATSDAPTVQDLCRIFYEESTFEGVDPAVAFCQSMKETGFLTFRGRVPITAYNFAGIGAVDNDASAYATFSSVREGIRAQIQHLKAYASKEALKNPCVDPRFKWVTRGCAPYVEWLGSEQNPTGKGWATDANYGYSIINDYMRVLYKY